MTPDPVPSILHPQMRGLKASDFTGCRWILKKETDRVAWVVTSISELAPGDGDQSGYFDFDPQTTVYTIGCLMVLENSEIFVSIAKS